MAENPLGLPLYYLRCAKHGKFQKCAQTAMTMLRMYYGSFVGNFDAGKNGAYYLYVESNLPQGIWLVCPDNTFDFETLALMDAAVALEYIASYCDIHDIPKWVEFAEWITNKDTVLEQAIGLITYVEVGGLVTANIPTWTNPQGSVSTLLRWFKQLVLNAETDTGETIPMSSLRDTSVNRNKFMLPIQAHTSLNGDFSLGIVLQT